MGDLDAKALDETGAVGVVDDGGEFFHALQRLQVEIPVGVCL